MLGRPKNVLRDCECWELRGITSFHTGIAEPMFTGGARQSAQQTLPSGDQVVIERLHDRQTGVRGPSTTTLRRHHSNYPFERTFLIDSGDAQLNSLSLIPERHDTRHRHPAVPNGGVQNCSGCDRHRLSQSGPSPPILVFRSISKDQSPKHQTGDMT